MHGEPWTPLLDKKLKHLWLEYSKSYSEKKVISKLTKYFKRNNGSIIARLKKHELIAKPEPILYEFDEDRYNEMGYDPEGFDEDGYDVMGIDREGINRNGWNEHLQSLSLEVLIFQKDLS